MPALLISAHFHDGRYHGQPQQGEADWPPSPARLFQALVAGAAHGATLDRADADALFWLETLAAPTIGAPAARDGAGFTNFVPNNDLDAVNGDPARVNEIRAGKTIRPILFDAETPLLYCWRFNEGDEATAHAPRICALAERLYQLGRGVDMAWAHGEVLGDNQADTRMAAYDGPVHRPSKAGSGPALAIPNEGSLASLIVRHEKMRRRFTTVYEARPTRREPDRMVAVGQTFAQPPKPRFRQVAYDSPHVRLLFDLSGADGGRHAWRLDRIVKLTEQIRDAAVEMLKGKVKLSDADVESAIRGRADSSEADKAQRIRMTPLPSIGHRHADRAIRRTLVDVPPNCRLRPDDLAWALTGLAVHDDDGQILAELATPSDESMLRQYAADARVWRTVTPAALPVARRRIDPAELRQEQSARRRESERRRAVKNGKERQTEEREAAAAVLAALRHAGIRERPTAVRVQREPFEAKGERAEAFAPGTRFAKERLWHVEIEFAEPVRGPLIIGDGRYLGLGLMAPARERAEGILAYQIVDGLAAEPDPIALARALRRAVIARVQESLRPRTPIPTFFTGHLENGDPARSGGHEHLAFVFDAARARLLILAPHVIERRDATPAERRNLTLLGKAMTGFVELRAGAAGKLRLAPVSVDVDSDPLFAARLIWESATPYCVARHAKNAGAQTALFADVARECGRSHLPRPQIASIELRGVQGQGLTGRARLTFATAVRGPILIGRSRHFGGGLFASADAVSSPTADAAPFSTNPAPSRSS